MNRSLSLCPFISLRRETVSTCSRHNVWVYIIRGSHCVLTVLHGAATLVCITHCALKLYRDARSPITRVRTSVGDDLYLISVTDC